MPENKQRGAVLEINENLETVEAKAPVHRHLQVLEASPGFCLCPSHYSLRHVLKAHSCLFQTIKPQSHNVHNQARTVQLRSLCPTSSHVGGSAPLGRGSHVSRSHALSSEDAAGSTVLEQDVWVSPVHFPRILLC